MRKVSILIFMCAMATLFGCLYPPVSPSSPDSVIVPKTSPEDDVDKDAPSAEMQALVGPLRALGMEQKDAAKAAKFFLDFADVISRDDSVLKTTEDIREGYIRAETLMLQKTEMVGKYPGFGKAKDDILAETLGLDRVLLTSEKRSKAVEVFKAMAWALGG